jgi:hypothetical protein
VDAGCGRGCRLASVCGGLIYFGWYLPFIWVDLNEQYMLVYEKIFACMLSTGAFGVACSYVAKCVSCIA